MKKICPSHQWPRNFRRNAYNERHRIRHRIDRWRRLGRRDNSRVMGYFKWRGGFFYRVWHLNAKYYSNSTITVRSFRVCPYLSYLFLHSLSLSLSPLLLCLSSMWCRPWSVPWDKRLHFLIFKCAQTSYPANSLPPVRYTEVLLPRFPRG